MSVMKAVENGVQAKSVIENLISEGYSNDHIHVFAHSNKRAEDIAKFFDVDAGKTSDTEEETSGFLSTIKNLFQTTEDDFDKQLQEIGVTGATKDEALKNLSDGKLVIFAHHPQ